MSDYIQLKKSNCKNCYKCIRHCPVKSIRFSGNQAHIVSDECILCGQCFVVCPQNAKQIADDTEKARVLIDSGEKIFASIAPSFAANYDGIGIKTMEKALKGLGFYGVEETAIGAAMVKREYENLVRDKRQDVIISSCCQSVNLMIEKHFPEALPYLAKVITPMQAHCMDIKRRHPDAKTVFIGPCLSKKDEASRFPGIVDCVLTFEDLTNWLEDKDISLDPIQDTNDKSLSRLFPTAGGILKTMDRENSGYTYISVDGIEDCVAALNDIITGGFSECFIEMSACSGSCIGGPVMEKYHHTPLRDYQIINRYAGKTEFEAESLPQSLMAKDHVFLRPKKQIPGKADLESLLKKMGKTKSEDELNCGSCGYNTCRDKAVAVYQGKADLTMCLPFLKDKAESFSDNIISNTPNGIVVLNEALEVQQINDAALRLMNIRRSSDILGEHVISVLDPEDFLRVLESGKNISEQMVYLAEYGKYVEQTIIFDSKYHILICIMRDITDEENERDKKKKVSRKTIETTDKVVEKQMRVVQDIAFLLGETAAETKIALTKLKESLEDE
ncbi:MAG TPA: [Fe-Fe] hydrogenase large subunit C-terminal domain-containing protein [Bacillota bacterium]|nr:[Fe-Fe] hydrogenase large subunit C-terminal domain-containing protein [Bacillota bacterium]